MGFDRELGQVLVGLLVAREQGVLAVGGDGHDLGCHRVGLQVRGRAEAGLA